MDYINVAIDGPAGAGKSTIAKMLAKKLDYVYVDTGAMYRAITYYALKKDIDLTDESQYSFLDDIEINLTSDGKVYVDDEDVTRQIRERDVTNNVSTVSSLKVVRDKLVNLQRNMALKNNVIMDGRDIGSNVLKAAQVKIYLTASVYERARRRFSEMLENNGQTGLTFEELQQEIERRDYLDSNRDLNPLKRADDAILIDTSHNTINEVVEKIKDIIVGRVTINE